MSYIYSSWQSMTRRHVLLAAGALGSSAVSWGQTAVTRASVIRLGQSLALTGLHAVLGRAYQASASAAFMEANSNRGSGSNLQFELISLDDEGQPDITTANVKRLAEEHQVQALFGFVGPGADRAGAMAAAAQGLPYVAPVSGSVELRSARRPGTYIFRASHADEIRYIANHAELIGVSRLALVYELTFLGLEMRNTMLDLLDGNRRTDVMLANIDTAGSEYTVPGAVATIMSNQPQAIVLGSNDVASAAFVKSVRAAGFKGYLYALSSVGSQGLASQLNELVSGISVTQVVPFALTETTAISRKHSAFCRRHGITPSFHSMEAWIGANLFIDAAKRARGVTAKALSVALGSAPPIDLGGYTAQWYASKPNPRAPVSLTVYNQRGRLIA
jgi:branched-chain amino acid transport system substrate-binding protein